MKHIFAPLLNKIRLLPFAIGAVFTFLAGRIAFTQSFPLPYDEGFHFGLIKLYTHHLNPFLASQPAGADAYGAVARDPSYLYHYLLSFPLRLLQVLGLSEHAQILALRGLNIALGLATLYLVYRLALRLGLSQKTALLPVAALAITPVFYAVSAQINYDNLLIGLTVLTVLMVLSVTDKLRSGAVPVAQVVELSSLLLLASIVKYSYLPIALVAAVYVLAVALKYVGLKGSFSGLFKGFRSLASVTKVLLVMLIAVSGLLWFQRDGMNVVLYHTPHPQCQAVLSVERCNSYAPWARNYQLHQTVAQRPINGLALGSYTKQWAKSMFVELYSTISVQGSSVVYTPYMVMCLLAAPLIALGALLAARFAIASRRIRVYWWPLAAVSAGYVAILWAQNYSDYHHLHFFIAVQGRYLLPVMPFVYLFTIYGYVLLAERASVEIARIQSALLTTVESWTVQPVTLVLRLAGALRLI